MASSLAECRQEKEDLTSIIHNEPERIKFIKSGLQVPGFDKVFLDGEYTGYLLCTMCTNCVTLMKQGGISTLKRHTQRSHGRRETLNGTSRLENLYLEGDYDDDEDIGDGSITGDVDHLSQPSSSTSLSTRARSMEEKDEITNVINTDPDRVTYDPLGTQSLPGLDKVYLDGVYVKYLRCTQCVNTITLLKDTYTTTLRRHLQKNHKQSMNNDVHDSDSDEERISIATGRLRNHQQPKQPSSSTSVANSQGSGGPDRDPDAVDKKMLIDTMYSEPQRVSYVPAGMDNLKGFKKVDLDGKFTGYLRCTKCTTRICLIKKGKSNSIMDFTRHCDRFHGHEDVNYDSDEASYDDRNDDEENGSKRRRKDPKDDENGGKNGAENASKRWPTDKIRTGEDQAGDKDGDLDNEIKRLKVKKLKTEIKADEQRMKQEEEEHQQKMRNEELRRREKEVALKEKNEKYKYYKNINTNFTKIMKAAEVVINHVTANHDHHQDSDDDDDVSINETPRNGTKNGPVTVIKTEPI